MSYLSMAFNLDRGDEGSLDSIRRTKRADCCHHCLRQFELDSRGCCLKDVDFYLVWASGLPIDIERFGLSFMSGDSLVAKGLSLI